MSDRATRSLHAALEQHADLHPGEILTNWVVVYETAGPDGQRIVGWETGETTTEWHALGLLVWMERQMELAGQPDEEEP